MINLDSIWARVLFSLILIVGLLNAPVPVFSQDDSNIQNLILNGGFEEGFQGGFGVGYGWGGFNNGEAITGWNADTWDKVVIAGQSAQLIEIKNATQRDRYAGIYQTVSVVPGQQYKLIINGLVRSEEGDINLSDYGYRLQYAVDYNGNTAWELIDNDQWLELAWDEQPLYDPPDGVYRFDTFETTITARNDKLTLFVRGWKKWINNGSGIFNLDEISFIGPAPNGFQAPAAQTASVGDAALPVDAESVTSDSSSQVSESQVSAQNTDLDSTQSQTEETSSQTATSSETETASQPATSSSQADASSAQTEPASPLADDSQLPVSGQGSNDSINFIIMSGLALLLVLFVGAITATIRQRNSIE